MKIASKNYKGYFGTFFMGLTLGVVAAPCLGPFILGLLTYVGQTGDPLLGFLYFLVLSIGMGLPLCILAIFSGGIERLPRSGEWMVWVKKAMGWILVGVGAYLVKPLLPPSVIKDSLLFLVMIMAGIHLGWMDKTGQQGKRFGFIKKSLGTVIALTGTVFWLSAIQPEQGVAWQPYSQEAMVAAKDAQKPVMLDFYADWCLPCKELDHRTFADERVVALSQDFARLRLDLTRRQPYQNKILRHYRVRGVPTVIFFNSKGTELTDLRVEAFVKADDFAARMQRALDESAASH
jgi:thiol:disulfide interchange protein DsbD